MLRKEVRATNLPGFINPQGQCFVTDPDAARLFWEHQYAKKGKKKS
jgi:hypothetical protein